MAARGEGGDVCSSPAGSGAGLAEGRNRDEYDAAFDATHGVEGEAQIIALSGREVLDDDVCLFDHVLEEAKSGRRLDIEGSAALVRAEIQPEGAGTAMRAIGGEGPDAARGMAGWRLEGDDIGAEFGEEFRAEGAGDARRKIEDAEVGEGGCFAHGGANRTGSKR